MLVINNTFKITNKDIFLTFLLFLNRQDYCSLQEFFSLLTSKYNNFLEMKTKNVITK